MQAAKSSSDDVDLARFRAVLNDAPLAVYDARGSSFLAIPASLDPIVLRDYRNEVWSGDAAMR